MSLFFFSFVSLCFFYCKLNACEQSNNPNFYIQKDSLGRLIILQKNVKEKSVEISIDRDSFHAISCAGQDCYDFYLEMTNEGDIIVLWYAVDPPNELFSIYATVLPSGSKEWMTPVCLSTENEYVSFKSLKLIVISRDNIEVFWEATEYFDSEKEPGKLDYRMLLRNVNGSVNSWGQACTFSKLR